jgi:hypothetical protein
MRGSWEVDPADDVDVPVVVAAGTDWTESSVGGEEGWVL